MGELSAVCSCQTTTRSAPDAASVVRDAQQCSERISIPEAPELKVIVGGDQSTFDMTFDGSPTATARAPLTMDRRERSQTTHAVPDEIMHRRQLATHYDVKRRSHEVVNRGSNEWVNFVSAMHPPSRGSR